MDDNRDLPIIAKDYYGITSGAEDLFHRDRGWGSVSVRNGPPVTQHSETTHYASPKDPWATHQRVVES